MERIKKISSIIILTVGYLMVISTLISLLESTSHWFIQVFNFPRLQALIVLTLCLLAQLLLTRKISKYFAAAVCIAIVINAYYLFPYTPFATKEVAQAKEQKGDRNVVSILVANVYMHNKESKKLIDLVAAKQPTLLLAMEVNDRWIKALQPLEKQYPFKIIYPSENTYGMALYSKLPLQQTETLFFNHDSVPSFICTVKFSDSSAFELLTIHPVAPKSSKHPDNKKDKEIGLIKAGKRISKTKLPAIVAGDFNDVGWSPNTSRFEDLSGLKDVRCGRGFYATFNSKSFLMRWPLDYVYVSHQFKVVSIERTDKIGSDHFPFFVKLTMDQ